MECVWVVILFLHWSLSGAQQFDLEGESVVVAAPGSDVTLPCSLKPSLSAVDMDVKWTRTDLSNTVVHHYKAKQDQTGDQDPSFRDRTALFNDELQYGNTSLLLKSVKGSDGGQYRCQVDSDHWQSHISVLLKTEATGRAPVITVQGSDSGGVHLQCESRGWWPVPELQWLDSEGAELPAGVKESFEDDGKFYVRLHITAHKSDNNTYICRVKLGQVMMEEKIDITAIGTSPEISVLGPDASGGVQLLCESRGWSSQPELQWQDSAGLPAGCKQPHGDGETFSVSHYVTACNSAASVFSCRVKEHPRMLTEIDISGIGSKPRITVEGLDGSGGVRLRCETTGWKSEPELQWISGGAELPAGDKESHRDNRLYTVRLRISAQISGAFICRVKQHPRMEAEINISAQG